MSSVFAGGRASSLLTIFNSSTDDASSAFSFESTRECELYSSHLEISID